MSQNVAYGRKYLRANQNAERLHGLPHSAVSSLLMNSLLGWGIPYNPNTQIMFTKDKTKKAKKAGRVVNKFMQKYPMVKSLPYVPQAIQAANVTLDIADAFSELMSSFGPSGGGSLVSHPGATAGAVAGVANGVTIRRSAPKIRQSKGVIRIMHKELLFTVKNTTTLNVQNTFAAGQSMYQVNAGAAITFPWLSTIASQYDYYRFKRLRLVYVPMCSTTETGRVMLGYDPDSTDAVPTDRQGLSSYSCSAESSAWATSSLDCKLSDVAKWYYNDNSSVGSASSSYGALIDQGQVFAATWGGAGTNSIGEVYVLYDVELKDPQPSAGSLYQSYGTGSGVTVAFPSNYPLFSQTPTSSSVSFKTYTTGTYYVSLTGTSTGISTPSSITGGTILGEQWGSGGSAFGGFIVFTATDVCTLTVNLSSPTKWTAYSTKTSPFTVYTAP